MSKQRTILSSGEVAEMLGVDPKTVTRWANCGILPHFRTPGGHRRFYMPDVTALLVEWLRLEDDNV